MIELSKIRIDGGTQPRVELNQDSVAEYAEAYRAGEKLPPVKLFFDGSDYWMADGFHRYFAAKTAGKKTIQEDITPGSKRDAVLFSLSANSKHGLKRSNADKRRAVETLLADPEWAQWSNEKIASTCAVSPHTVAEIKKSHSANAESECISHSANAESDSVKYITKNGTEATMNTANIGRKNAAQTDDSGIETAPKPPKPKLLSEEESARILAENEHLKEVAETLAADARDSLEDNMSMAKIFDADDRLAAAMKEIDRLRAEVSNLRSQIVGLTNGKNDAIRHAKGYKLKCERLEKQILATGQQIAA